MTEMVQAEALVNYTHPFCIIYSNSNPFTTRFRFLYKTNCKYFILKVQKSHAHFVLLDSGATTVVARILLRCIFLTLCI